MENGVQATSKALSDPTMHEYYMKHLRRALIIGIGPTLILFGVAIILFGFLRIIYRHRSGLAWFIVGLLVIIAGIVLWILKSKLTMLI